MEGDSPVPRGILKQQRYANPRVGLFGTAASIGRYTSPKAKYRHETDSEQVE